MVQSVHLLRWQKYGNKWIPKESFRFVTKIAERKEKNEGCVAKKFKIDGGRHDSLY